MFTNVVKDVGIAMYASMVRGIVLHYAYHLRLLVTYGEVTRSLNCLPNGGQLGQALRLITEDDHRNGRPLSTAVVVNSKEKIPGEGFFTQCLELGYQFSEADRDDFWRGQLSKLQVAPFLLSELAQVDDRVNPNKGGHYVVPQHVTRFGQKQMKLPVIEGDDRETRVVGKITPAINKRVDVTDPNEVAAIEAHLSRQHYTEKSLNIRPARSIDRETGGLIERSTVPCDTADGICACGLWHRLSGKEFEVSIPTLEMPAPRITVAKLAECIHKHPIDVIRISKTVGLPPLSFETLLGYEEVKAIIAPLGWDIAQAPPDASCLP